MTLNSNSNDGQDVTPANENQAPFAPHAVQTFADAGDRKRLTAVAVKAVTRLAQSWDLKNPEAAALLGVSTSTWERMKRGTRDNELSQDQLTRASALIGIYKALHLIFADQMADRWPHLKNNGPLFNHNTPVEAMIDGGIPHMLDVRRLLDAVRGGM